MSNTEAMRAAFEVIYAGIWLTSGPAVQPDLFIVNSGAYVDIRVQGLFVMFLAATAQATAPLEAAIKKVHTAKGRHHSQIAMCDLYELVGLPCVRPVAIRKGEAPEGKP